MGIVWGGNLQWAGDQRKKTSKTGTRVGRQSTAEVAQGTWGRSGASERRCPGGLLETHWVCF